MNIRFASTAFPLAVMATVFAAGCIRTTHEIKPIHITMDINLRVDRELDDFFGEIDNAPVHGPQPVVAGPAQETPAPKKEAEPGKEAEQVTETKPEETNK